MKHIAIETSRLSGRKILRRDMIPQHIVFVNWQKPQYLVCFFVYNDEVIVFFTKKPRRSGVFMINSLKIASKQHNILCCYGNEPQDIVVELSLLLYDLTQRQGKIGQLHLQLGGSDVRQTVLPFNGLNTDASSGPSGAGLDIGVIDHPKRAVLGGSE